MLHSQPAKDTHVVAGWLGAQAVTQAQKRFEAAVAAGNTSLVRRLLTIPPGSEQGSTSILTMAAAVEQACAQPPPEEDEGDGRSVESVRMHYRWHRRC